MLASQRALFDIPRDVCYLNAAAWSPLPIAVQEKGRAGVGRKSQPWTLPGSIINDQNERARAAAARLINASPDDVALIPSVGYGVATAGKVLKIPAGSRVLVIEDDHSSPVLEWMDRSVAAGFTVETVKRPADGDWTAAVLAAIARPGAPPLALASMSSVHWSDGGLIDVDRIAPVLRALGAAFLIDATHGAGVQKIDVATLDPDFLIFPTYKWLLGPYGRAFLYIAKRHQEGTPLEQTAHGRRAVKAEQTTYLLDLRYVPNARRFDMGERDHFISMDMAASGIEFVAGLGQQQVLERLSYLTGLIGAQLQGAGVAVPETRVRAPHVICLTFKHGMPDGLIEKLAAEKIYVAPRLGRIRVSPHVYNDEADVERFTSTLQQLLKA